MVFDDGGKGGSLVKRRFGGGTVMFTMTEITKTGFERWLKGSVKRYDLEALIGAVTTRARVEGESFVVSFLANETHSGKKENCVFFRHNFIIE